MRKINPINYCTYCGHAVSIAIPEGDNRERHICQNCGEIQYQNPKIVAGCIPVWEDKILLCQRAIEPRRGLWTIPAGFLENDESIEEGAARETWEEACAKVENQHLYQIFTVASVNHVYMLFRAQLAEPNGFDVGAESLAVKLVAPDEIPWDNIGFRVVEKTLARFIEEQQTGNFNIEIDTIR